MYAGRVYRLMLRLYPCDYRARFAREMENAFERAVEERRPAARPVLFLFLVREAAGLSAAILKEWIAKWSTDRSVRGRSLPDVRMKRPPGVPRQIWFAGPGLNGQRYAHQELRGGCSPDTSL